MADAAYEALKSLGRPATVREIHDEICRRKLFLFGAKDPVSVLGKALRKRTEGSTTLNGEARFRSPRAGVFEVKRRS